MGQPEDSGVQPSGKLDGSANQLQVSETSEGHLNGSEGYDEDHRCTGAFLSGPSETNLRPTAIKDRQRYTIECN